MKIPAEVLIAVSAVLGTVVGSSVQPVTPLEVQPDDGPYGPNTCDNRPFQSDIRWFNQIADDITDESHIVPEGTLIFTWPMERVASFASVDEYPLEWGEPIPWGLWLVPPDTLLLPPEGEFIIVQGWAVVRTDACLGIEEE